MEQPQKALPHFLVSATILFTAPDQPVAMVPLNCVIVQEDKVHPVQSIAKMQQSAQFQFQQRYQDGTLTVTDVIINSFMYLGDFTQEDFHKAPEGMTLQEQQAVQNRVQAEIDSAKDMKVPQDKKKAQKPDLKAVPTADKT